MANYDLGTVGFTIQNTGAEETASDVNTVVQAIQRAERQFESLQQAMNKGKLTHEQYQRGVQQTQSTIERLNRVLDNQASAADQQAFAFNRAGRGLNEFGFYAQQVGYQVGDFFVQVQSGTNFLVAFGQQATQLAGLIPGVLGAAIGIGISAVTALGGALFRTSENARTFEDALNGVNDVLSETSSLVKVANGDLSELEERFGGLSPAIKALAEARADVSIRQMADSAKALRDELNELYNGNAWLNVSRAEDLSNAFQLNTRESYALTDALNNLSRQDTLAGQVEAATRLRELLLQMFGPVQDMTSEQFNFYLQVLQTEEAYRELLNRTGEVSGDVGLLSSLMDLFTDSANSAASAVEGIKTASDNALSSVTNLASKMWEAAQARLAAMQELERMKIEFSPAGIALDKYGGRGTTSNRPVTMGTGEVVDFSSGDSGGTRRQTQIRKEIELTKKLTQAEKDRQNVLESIEGSLGDGFMAMVQGTESVKDAFKSMATEIIKELYRVLVVQRMVGSFDMATGQGTGLMGLIGGFFGGSSGPMFLGGRASGGSVMPNRPYLVGEHGPELVIPRHSGTVMNANQTSGVLSGGGDITVQNNITVTGSDAAMVRAEVAKMIPQITNATKAAVIDAKQRGGQMAAAFR